MLNFENTEHQKHIAGCRDFYSWFKCVPLGMFSSINWLHQHKVPATWAASPAFSSCSARQLIPPSIKQFFSAPFLHNGVPPARHNPQNSTLQCLCHTVPSSMKFKFQPSYRECCSSSLSAFQVFNIHVY